MKHLTNPIRPILFLVLAFMMMLSTQASAAETVMMCELDDGDKLYYTHIKPLIGEPTVVQKIDGKWGPWRVSCPNSYKADELSVYDSGTKMQSYSQENFSPAVPELDIKKGDPVRFHMTTVLDFEFGSYTYECKAYISLVQSLGDFTLQISEFGLDTASSCEIIK